MRDSLALLAVLFLIALFFLPAYYIGPLYFLLVVLYLLALYAVERRGLKRVEELIDVAFFLTLMCLLMKKFGEPLWQGLALGLLLLALEFIKRRVRAQGSS
ncbi:hypothetical protein [Thermococcus sp. AM4]|uniref:hypothetical protein n=1 Tax=Thermococcus sp. (strain AM4) TaxID=246969 RepID=UPI0002299A8B|nr:hypothetical protein [Thermococcus sp. AM4]AEO13987.1 hypothetical protein TAM4_2393 [Thermococcus sp. AM4]